MKVVLDTNVLLSGLMYPRSQPGTILKVWREGGFDLIMSRFQLSEIGRVLAYPKIHKHLHWPGDEIERFLRQLYLRSIVVETGGIRADVPADADDTPILAALLASQGDWLVTGDSDLLALRSRHPIVTVAEFSRGLL